MNSRNGGRGPYADDDGTDGTRPSRRPPTGRLATALLGVTLVWAGGCATQAPSGGGGSDGDDPGTAAADRVVADELAGVFAGAFDPLATTVQTPADEDDPASVRLVDALAARGFGIQRVAADQGAHFLDVAREIAPREGGGTELRWRAAIGPIEVRRDYLLGTGGALSTASPIRLSGGRVDVAAADLEPVAGLSVDPAHRRIAYAAGETPDRPVPVISLITPELVERVARNATRGRSDGRAAPSAQALNASRVETENLFYGGGSNFGSALDGRDRVARRVIVFADDSLQLGADNRRMIESFVASEVARDDVISLVGCSNGPTALAIGNEGLALGRAERVSEELVTHGIGTERIYDEGCWAPVSADDRFPSRGVVIELWRTPA